jgi:predicted esterase
MSPFTSVRDAASNLAGSLLSYLVATHHNNLEQMKIISCPVFLIHGKKDKVIPYQHSETLYNQIKS